jgi:hypothetical protein
MGDWMVVGGHHHVGIVVPILEADCVHFTHPLGTHWGPFVDRELQLRDSKATISSRDSGSVTRTSRRMSS